MVGKRKKSETLEELLIDVRKKHGERALAIAQTVEELYTVTTLPTGIEQVDKILGGGFPRGHMSELFGPWSSGKTYILLKTIAETQRNGGTAAYIDTELSFSPLFARAANVDMSKLLLSTPDCGEDALDLMVDLAKQGVDLVILDSITSLASRDELAKAVQVGGGVASGVRLWNEGIKRIKPVAFNKNVAIAFTNQVRDNFGVMYGPATTEPMGWKSKHEAVLRLEVRRKEWIKKNDTKVGQVTLVRVNKSKYDGCVPYAETTMDIMFDATNRPESSGSS